jgi:signal transduction histidine kinase
MVNLFRAICALLISLLWHGVAPAGSTTATFAYFVDTASAHSSAPPIYASYRSFNGNLLSLDYQKHPVWVRVTLPMDSQAPSSAEIGIRISPYQLSNVTLFEFVDGRWLTTDGGARAKFRKSNPCLDNQHCFKINSKSSGPAYVRLQTPTIFNATIEVLDVSTMRADSAAGLASVSISTTMAAGLWLLGLFFLASEKSRLSFAFLFFQSTVLLALTGTSGLLTEWFSFFSPSTWLLITHLAIIGRTSALAFLLHTIVGNYQSIKIFDRGLKGLYCVQLSAVLLIFAGYEHVAFQINLVVLMTLPPIALLGVLTAGSMPGDIKRVLVVGCLIFFLMLSWGVVSSTNIFFEGDAGAMLEGTVDRKLNGLVVALFLLWFVVSENGRQKMLQVEAEQQLRIVTLEAKQHEEATKERGLLIDMMTHEIKNPLSTMRFAVSALRSKSHVDQEEKERFHRVVLSIDRIDRLLDQVALSNKLRHTDTEFETEQLQVFNLIQEIIDDCDEPERINLHAPGEAYLLVNKAIFLVIIENVIGNACKYSVPGTPIEVTIVPLYPGEALRITVSNQISPNVHLDKSQMFKPYYRHPDTSGQPGTGLGLSLVKSATEKLGGIIEVRIVNSVIYFEITFP